MSELERLRKEVVELRAKLAAAEAEQARLKATGKARARAGRDAIFALIRWWAGGEVRAAWRRLEADYADEGQLSLLRAREFAVECFIRFTRQLTPATLALALLPSLLLMYEVILFQKQTNILRDQNTHLSDQNETLSDQLAREAERTYIAQRTDYIDTLFTCQEFEDSARTRCLQPSPRARAEAARSLVRISRADISLSTLDGDLDLIGANLDHAPLDGIALSGAKLSDANLIEARLGGADLSGVHAPGLKAAWASLSGADLSDANLSAADLSDAILIGATLSGADLSGASLTGADLSDTTLSGVSLAGAQLQGANLCSTDLSGVTFGTGSSGRKLIPGSRELAVIFRGAHIDSRTVWPEGVAPRDDAAWGLKRDGCKTGEFNSARQNRFLKHRATTPE